MSRTVSIRLIGVFLFAAALFQIAGGYLPFIVDLGADIGAKSAAVDTAIIPAGWAFSIWGLIFVWCLYFAVAVLATPNRAAPVVGGGAALLAALAFFLNGVWELYVPLRDIDAISQIIIAAILAAALLALFAVMRADPLSTAQRLTYKAPLALLAGWLTAATFVGASSVMLNEGLTPTTPVLIALLAGVVFVGGLVIRAGAGWFYAGPIIWALAAIIAKNADGGSSTITVAAALGVVVILAIRVLTRR